MHSVRIELAKLILVGTRMTYQATGDAGAGAEDYLGRKTNKTEDNIYQVHTMTETNLVPGISCQVRVLVYMLLRG